MSLQRRGRHRQPAKVYPTKVTTDSRGNKHHAPDMDNPIDVTAAFIPQRSARAEVTGQQQIQVTRMILSSEVPGMDLWSRVEWRGEFWDCVTPPQYHHGTRHTRHWSIDLRERP